MLPTKGGDPALFNLAILATCSKDRRRSRTEIVLFSIADVKGMAWLSEPPPFFYGFPIRIDGFRMHSG